MFGHTEHHATDKSQAPSGILTPAPDTDGSDGPELGSRKRKRDAGTIDHLLKDKFLVKPYPATSNSKLYHLHLQPLMLIPRSHLPLSSIDVALSTKTLGSSRLFEAHIKILELEDRMGSQPTVLLARMENARTIYVIERESQGLYVLFQLGSWINLTAFKAVAVAIRPDLPTQPESTVSLPDNLQPVTTPQVKYKHNSKKRLAIEALQSMVKRPAANLLSDSQVITSDDTQPATTPQLVPDGAVDEGVSAPTALEIFENVRTQYFEALYLNKASLAYFAKGPLSRARAAFHMDFDSTLDLKDHIAFLESLVLSSTLLEKKYRDGIPSCISLLDLQDQSDENADDTGRKIKKRKTAQKMKPDKTGLYPIEDGLIRRWWEGHEDDGESGAPGDSREDRMKQRISQLRIRETQLQMIVILEVLALQPLASNTGDVGGGLPSVLPTGETIETKSKPSKAKKPDHLTMLIDLHVDRLCIWQSLALEGVTKAPSSESQGTNGNLDGPVALGGHTDNILRDFCVEVIAPFFSSRLPDRCAGINKKLGGPVVVSPPKPRMSKSASFSGVISRPGAATKRPVPVKPRQSLKRILTDDRERRSVSRGPNRAISLMRSATMPVGLVIKREGSEAPSLSSIPNGDSQSGGLAKRFARREVDLSAMASKPSTKAEKQAQIDMELKEAISALKKPDRGLAGRTISDTAEKRTITSSSRKSKKPMRNPLFQGVQITATPKTNRLKDVFPQHVTNPSPAGDMLTNNFLAPPSSSSRSLVPQSVSRSSSSMLSKNPFLSSVQATPTRKSLPASSRSKDIDALNGCPPSSPLHVRKSSAQLFAAVPDSAVKPSKAPESYGIADTPVKGGHGHAHPAHPVAFDVGSNKENLREKDESAKAPGMNKKATEEQSIYKSLGWDDDVDDIDELA